MNENLILKGDISKGLIKLALPIMGTSFVEMAYNLIDMLWIGRLGSNQMSAVGTAGFFMWFMISISMLPRIGAEVFVSRAVGAGENEVKRKYIEHTLMLGFIIILSLSGLLHLFVEQCVDFFNFEDVSLHGMASEYLSIISVFMIFPSLNFIMTGIFNAHGNSTIPFRLNVMGLLINICLDPILIFGFAGFSGFGVSGAAYATVFAHICVSIGYLYFSKYRCDYFKGVQLFRNIDFKYIKDIFVKGFPVAAQSAMFACIGMVLARVIVRYGSAVIGVQRVVGQIESISWRSGSGFGTGLTAFIGQNYGAKQYDRVKAAYLWAMKFVFGLGTLVTIAFWFLAEPIIQIFFFDSVAIAVGISCLRIMAVSQIFVNMEIISSSALNGVGNTFYSSVVSMTMNLLRIPMAIFLSDVNVLGLDGVWWAISISSILKGILVGIRAFYKFIIRGWRM